MVLAPLIGFGCLFVLVVLILDLTTSYGSSSQSDLREAVMYITKGFRQWDDSCEIAGLVSRVKRARDV